jgi:hypothetical protein
VHAKGGKQAREMQDVLQVLPLTAIQNTSVLPM